jgi:LysR family transcriptional regulator, transcriptional activator for dmlA
MNDISLLLCFKVIYQTLNLSKAGEKLSLSKASISKKLIALEEELGGKLFIRSTRKVIPTPEADLLYEKVNFILEATGEIDSIFKESKRLKGKIRVTAPQTMCVSFLGDILLKFQEKFPEISIELISTNNVLDVIEENIDLSLRINPPQSSSLVGKKVGNYRLLLVATPACFKKNPLKDLASLKHHSFMATQTHLANWKIKMNPSAINSFMTNDSVLIGNFIRSGQFIGLRANWDIKADLKNGKLVEILPKSATQDCGEVWLLSHPSKIKTARVHALFDYLIKELESFLN